MADAEADIKVLEAQREQVLADADRLRKEAGGRPSAEVRAHLEAFDAEREGIDARIAELKASL